MRASVRGSAHGASTQVRMHACKRSLAKAAKLPEANDTTIYGSARTSPRSFFEHYVRPSISAAIVHTDSLAIVNESTRLGSALLVPNSGLRA